MTIYSEQSVTIKPGETVSTILPHSEVCIHMRVAGKRANVELLNERMAQLYIDGRPFSAPITYGEAGIYRNEDGTFYCYPDGI